MAEDTAEHSTTHTIFTGREQVFTGAHLYEVELWMEGELICSATIAADREGLATTRIMFIAADFPSGKLAEYQVKQLA